MSRLLKAAMAAPVLRFAASGVTRPLHRADLIGMGDSDKLPDSGSGSYRFVEHRRYLDALWEALRAETVPES